MADAPEVVKADGKIRGCWLDGAGDLVVATNRGAVGVLQRRRDGTAAWAATERYTLALQDALPIGDRRICKFPYVGAMVGI